MLNALVAVVHEATSISSITTEATTLFTWVMTSLSSIVTTITANPILYMGFLMSLVGFVVGIMRRLMNLS